MLAERTRKRCPAPCARIAALMPSSGWMRRISASGSASVSCSPGIGRCGGRWNCSATSVTRARSRLPVRT
jgi:hypothetical protein